MKNADEFRREAEEAREKVNRDIAGVREILRRIADEASYRGKRDIERARGNHAREGGDTHSVTLH